MPLLGLVPVFAAVVLAGEGRFGAPNGQNVAGGPLASGAGAPAGAPTAGLGSQAAPAATAVATSSASTEAVTGTAGNQAAPNATANQGLTGQAAPGATTQGAPGAANAAQGATVTGATSQAVVVAGTTAGDLPTAGTTGEGVAVAGSAAQVAAGPGGGQDQGGGAFRAYAVQPGDTVKFVAQMYGVSPASISQASGLRNPDLVRVGQVLTIPRQPGWLYRVEPGESLDQIAARTRVPTEIILSASNVATGTVNAGDVILIPDQTSAVVAAGK
ncbi:MAG: LysM peptidoglycan-binding domain-containing protein [Chloroflexi bacterium]|nr:LysM peptidoglycan-binding domain-containing protein [Chloroflexota bacterium]